MSDPLADYAHEVDNANSKDYAYITQAVTIPRGPGSSQVPTKCKSALASDEAVYQKDDMVMDIGDLRKREVRDLASEQAMPAGANVVGSS